MIYIQFLMGFLLYITIATITYSVDFKQSYWYYPIGLIAGLGANFLWLWISKSEQNASSLVVKGLYWDAMLTITYAAVPMLMFGARLNFYQTVGFGLILGGLILTKVSV